MTAKLGSGRFKNATHPDVEKFTASITFDNELAYEDILGSLAHAKMLQHCKLIGPEEYQQIEDGLNLIAKKIIAGQVSFKIEDEDIHMNIERLLSELIGPVAGKLHTARSRNDQVALDIHLYLRKKIIVIIELLMQLQNTLIALAKSQENTFLPGYTHLQRAQPVSLTQYFLAYVSMFQRDIKRLQECWVRVNQSPLGACALAGTTLPIDKHFVADQLGFSGVYSNTLDAVSDRDFIVEFLSNAALISMHISRLSEELVLWSSQEFNFIQFDESFCTGSSIMPQKKNPDVAELGRAKTGQVYGALITVLTVLKGLPLTYNKDLQEDKKPLFETIKTLQATLAIYVPLLSTMTINTEIMQQAVLDGHLNATALADYLVTNGASFRSAHEIVGKMVAYSASKNNRLEELSLEELKQFSPLFTKPINEIVSIDRIIAAYNSNDTVQLTACDEDTKETQRWLTKRKKILSRAADVCPCE
jgi:argininosuccinate lyase